QIVCRFLGKINEAEAGNDSYLFSGLMLDSRKCRQIAAPPADVGKTPNLSDGRIRIRRGRQFGAEHELWNAHRLVDEDLFLIFRALAPLQNRFNGDDSGLKFKR